MIQNIKALVAGVVLRDKRSRYLLVQERQPKAYGLWNLPAGHVDKGETIQQTAVRECEEETGLIVELIDSMPLRVQLDDSGTVKLHSFEARQTGGSLLRSPDELLDARWLSPAEIRDLYKVGKIRDAWVVESINEVERHAHTRY